MTDALEPGVELGSVWLLRRYFSAALFPNSADFKASTGQGAWPIPQRLIEHASGTWESASAKAANALPTLNNF